MDHWSEKMSPWDTKTPRFYPPGKHPAMARVYVELKQAERWAFWSLGPELHRDGYEYLAWLRQKIADFEAREAELKAEAYYREEKA